MSDRFCCDYGLLNNENIDEKTPLPHIGDLLNRIVSKTVFSTLDLAWGYWQIPMHPDSVEKTAFVTEEGQYEWLVMPFGLKNAPSTFQRIIKNFLKPFVGRGVENYLDDIVVYTDSINEHEQLLRELGNAFKMANLRLRREKRHFFQSEISILGHLVSHRKIRPDPRKSIGRLRLSNAEDG